jgi:hypothetical protein
MPRHPDLDPDHDVDVLLVDEQAPGPPGVATPGQGGEAAGSREEEHTGEGGETREGGGSGGEASRGSGEGAGDRSEGAGYRRPQLEHHEGTDVAPTARERRNDGGEGAGRIVATGRAAPESAAFIPKRATVWKAQRDRLCAYLRGLMPDATDGQARLFLHVAYCQYARPWEYDDGVPVPHPLIERLDEDRRRHSAAAVWGPLDEAGVVVASDYERPGADGRGLCREFAVDAALVAGLADLRPRDSDAAARAPRADLFTGRRVRDSGARHLMTDENNHPVGGELYHEALKRLKDGYFYEPGVLAHLDRLAAVRDAARAALDAAGGHEFVEPLRGQIAASRAAAAARGWAFTQKVRRRIIDAYRDLHGEPRTLEYLAWRHARAVWLNDNACFDAVLKQHPEGTGLDGVKRYRLAYLHQSSGRMGAVGGMLQSCTAEMKAAAYDPLRDRFGLFNYDMRAAQPNLIIELFDEANAHARPPKRRGRTAPLQTEWIRRYVADPQAKASYAGAVGVEVGTWKTAICAVMMGGTLARDPAQSDGAVAKAVLADPACSTPESLKAVWTRLRGALGVFYVELHRWHVWIDTVCAHDPATSGPHRDGKGVRWVRNAAGETYRWDPNEEAHVRRAQLAAHLLQGKEQAFVLRLITLGHAFGYEVIAHEHDGAVTLGEVPQEAVARARELSGVQRAELVQKPFV